MTRVQLDRFEDNGWAVLLLGTRTFNLPREMLPPNASPGDVFEVTLTLDQDETRRLGEENRRLLDELLGREEKQ